MGGANPGRAAPLGRLASRPEQWRKHTAKWPCRSPRQARRLGGTRAVKERKHAARAPKSAANTGAGAAVVPRRTSEEWSLDRVLCLKHLSLCLCSHCEQHGCHAKLEHDRLMVRHLCGDSVLHLCVLFFLSVCHVCLAGGT